MYYNLFLDDERFPKDVKWVNLPLVEWVIVRNYDDFVRIIKQMGVPTNVSFDHDLAEKHYAACNGRTIEYDKFEEKTGYHCAKWLAHFCVDNKVPLPVYFCHTMNPIGRQNIISVIESARKVINGNQNNQ